MNDIQNKIDCDKTKEENKYENNINSVYRVKKRVKNRTCNSECVSVSDRNDPERLGCKCLDKVLRFIA